LDNAAYVSWTETGTDPLETEGDRSRAVYFLSQGPFAPLDCALRLASYEHLTRLLRSDTWLPSVVDRRRTPATAMSTTRLASFSLIKSVVRPARTSKSRLPYSHTKPAWHISGFAADTHKVRWQYLCCTRPGCTARSDQA